MTVVSSSCNTPLLGCLNEESHQLLPSASPPLSSSPAREDLRELGFFERRNPPHCLILLHIASFGKQGAELGSDESHVAMLTAKLFDIRDQSVGHPQIWLGTAFYLIT